MTKERIASMSISVSIDNDSAWGLTDAKNRLLDYTTSKVHEALRDNKGNFTLHMTLEKEQ